MTGLAVDRYTALRESIVDGIKELLPAKAAEMFVLQPVEGGSVLGAAIIAAAVDNYMKVWQVMLEFLCAMKIS